MRLVNGLVVRRIDLFVLSAKTDSDLFGLYIMFTSFLDIFRPIHPIYKTEIYALI